VFAHSLAARTAVMPASPLLRRRITVIRFSARIMRRMTASSSAGIAALTAAPKAAPASADGQPLQRQCRSCENGGCPVRHQYKRAAETVNVGPNVHGTGVLRLLRGHASRWAGAMFRRRHAVPQLNGRGRIQQFRLLLRCHADVGWLDVAMHEVVFVASPVPRLPGG